MDAHAEITHKQQLIATHKQRLHYLELQKAQFGLHTAPHIQIDIDNTRQEIQKLTQEIQTLSQAAMSTTATRTPAGTMPPVADLTANQRIRLREILINRFSLSELKTLCFDLGVDYDNLAGEAKLDKVLALITYYERRRQVAQLLAAGKHMRNDIDWSLST